MWLIHISDSSCTPLNLDHDSKIHIICHSITLVIVILVISYETRADLLSKLLTEIWCTVYVLKLHTCIPISVGPCQSRDCLIWFVLNIFYLSIKINTNSNIWQQVTKCLYKVLFLSLICSDWKKTFCPHFSCILGIFAGLPAAPTTPD